jgi:hypothetical protein
MLTAFVTFTMLLTSLVIQLIVREVSHTIWNNQHWPSSLNMSIIFRDERLGKKTSSPMGWPS